MENRRLFFLVLNNPHDIRPSGESVRPHVHETPKERSVCFCSGGGGCGGGVGGVGVGGGGVMMAMAMMVLVLVLGVVFITVSKYDDDT
jgi:hypothetical protein